MTLPAPSSRNDSLSSEAVGSQLPPVVSAVVLVDDPGSQPEAQVTVASLLAQTYPEVEVVAVCGPGAGPVIQPGPRADRLVTVDWPQGATALAALSAGLDRATGDFVMLQPHAGVVPATAVADMVASLLWTGSDLVTAAIEMVSGAARVEPAAMGSLFSRRRSAVTVSSHPRLVLDTGLRNKLFRRDMVDRMWTGGGGGGLTAETSMVLDALVAADAIDVVPVIGHLQDDPWVGDLATVFQTGDLGALAAHVAGLGAVRDTLAARGHSGLVRVIDHRICDVDLPVVAAAAGSFPPVFADAVVEAFGPLVRRVDATLPLRWQVRALVGAVVGGDIEAMVRWAKRCADTKAWANSKQSTPAVVCSGVADMAQLMRAGVRGRALAGSAAHTAAGVFGRMRAKGSQSSSVQVGGVDIGRQAGRIMSMAARMFVRKPGTHLGAADVPPWGLRLWAGYGPSGLLRLQIQDPVTVVTVSVDSDRLAVEGPDPGAFSAMELRGIDYGTVVPVIREETGWGCGLEGFIEGPDHRWELFVHKAGRWLPASAPKGTRFSFASLSGVGGGLVQVRSGPAMVATVVRHDEPVVTMVAHPATGPNGVASVRFDHVHGPPVSAVRLVHVTTRTTVPLAPAGASDARSGIPGWVLPLGGTRKYGQPLPLARGRWRVEAHDGVGWVGVGGQVVDQMGGAAGVWVHSVADDYAGTTYRVQVIATEVTVTSATGSGVVTTSASQLGRGQPAWVESQRRLRRRKSARLRQAVVIESFWGRQVACHPKALLGPLTERLGGWDVHWVIEPGRTYAPDGTQPVFRHTEQWRQLCDASAVVVTNSALDKGFRRSDGQVVVQTWHGTPLKLLGLDMFNFDHFQADYRRKRALEAAQWSLLLSPNEFCSDVFPRAFAYDGPLVECGSPRNDVLVNGLEGAGLVDLRRRLGLEPHHRVVLYAPTWRENDKAGRSWAATVPVDLESLAAGLGDDVVVLYRAHSYIREARRVAETHRVRNVSDYPDIQELYLLADVLVTDYSSVMFDYACLGRPMVFYCPDLEVYRDELRGWYFDLAGEAPGPITTTPGELSEHLAEALDSGVPQAHHDLYSAFRSRFCAWEHGDASIRVADRIVSAVRNAGGVC